MMNTLATITSIQRLTNFGTAFLSRHKEHWPPDEGTLAHEFTEQFPIRQLSSSEKIIDFTRELGIDAALATLPDGMHGFNCSMEGQSIVLLGEQEDFPGSREHTLFHELREVMECHFRERGYPTAQGQELEKRAEQFAIAVRMFGMMRVFSPLVEDAKAIEQAWKRWLAIGGLIILALGTAAGCALLPYLEDNFPKTK